MLVLRAYRWLQTRNKTWERTAIDPDFARRMRLAQRQATASDMSNPDLWRAARDKRYAVIKPGRSFGGCYWAESGARYGLEVRDPTLDQRVLVSTHWPFPIDSTPDRAVWTAA